ncbi:MAG: DinB family protein [Acidobacteria bacterium]|nr:MAG: DinB family protein [Acidobacteriota bacterium]
MLMNANTLLLSRPEATEYAPYYDKYISLIRGTDIIEILEKQLQDFPKFFSGRTEKDGELRYAAEKWSVKQVLGHLNDTERVFSYRALRISRNDKTPIEGYEQDDYVRYGPFEQCRLSDLVQDFTCVRNATISLFRNLNGEAWTRSGVANKNQVTVRALPYIIAGHAVHHRKILEERYFTPAAR